MTFHNPASKLIMLATCLALPLLMISGCTGTSEKHLEQLNKIIKIYNNSFESKSTDGGAKYVVEEKRKDYLIDYAEVQERVSFNESQILDFTYLKDGESVPLNIKDPEKEFDEARVLMRYKIIKAPSVTLKTVIIEQSWIHNGVLWQLEPDLKPFLQ